MKTAFAPLLLLSNANPLRWALRWGPPSVAFINRNRKPGTPFCLKAPLFSVGPKLCRGKRRAARCAAPTVFRSIQKRRVQEAAPYGPAPAATCMARPGAVRKPHLLQFSTRTGPSGPGGSANRLSDFARRKYCKIQQIRVPRNGGPGVSRHGERSSPLRRPPAILWFLSHRWERNSPRRAKPCDE